jgi:hypothetical protein
MLQVHMVEDKLFMLVMFYCIPLRVKLFNFSEFIHVNHSYTWIINSYTCDAYYSYMRFYKSFSCISKSFCVYGQRVEQWQLLYLGQLITFIAADHISLKESEEPVSEFKDEWSKSDPELCDFFLCLSLPSRLSSETKKMICTHISY